MRSLLGLKLYGLARKSHVHTEVCDPGLALFAGLNAVPKRSTLAEYASRLNTTARAFTYVNASVRNEEQAAEILAFADACEQRNGACPSLLAFDSTLTTYANLATLEQCGIGFLTLRRRTKRVLERVDAAPRGDWRSVRLTNAGRTFQRPRTLDQRVRLTGYPQPVRQIAVDNIGPHSPILLLTNQHKTAVAELVARYARRVLIENTIAETIDFFHLDALSSAVPLNVAVDLQLTLLGGTLYRLLGERLGAAHAHERPRTLFRKFVHPSADVVVRDDSLTVRFGRRAHNPVLEAAGIAKDSVPLPWLGNRRCHFAFV